MAPPARRPSDATGSATVISPFTAILRRSFKVAPSAGRITSPSSTHRPTRSSPIFSGPPGARRIKSPLRCTMAFGMPCERPKRACSRMCRISPCTGTRMSGRIHRYIVASSGRPGWPETWTCAWRSVTISTPRSDSAFIMRPMAISLPGICFDEKMTVSPSLSFSSWVSKAIRPRAALGSPCPPVATIKSWLRGRRIASSKRIGSGKSRR